jgi:hypothetical protein
MARVNQLDIHPLSHTERRMFQTEWKACQARFADDPDRAVYEADETILALMRARGYSAKDDVERFENISAAHPRLAADYRQGRSLVVRHRQGEASTEDLRQAMVHFREVFSELIGEEQHEEYKRAA